MSSCIPGGPDDRACSDETPEATSSSSSSSLFLSFDVETDGQSPTLNSMLSIGIVAFDSTGKTISTFQRNLLPLDGHIREKRCMEEFWAKQPEAWAFVNTNRIAPQDAMIELAQWLVPLCEKYTQRKWIAYPASFDWMWLKYYYEKFTSAVLVNIPKIGYTCECLNTLMNLYCELNPSVEEDKLAKELSGGAKTTHNPLDDARAQACIYHGLIQLFKQINDPLHCTGEVIESGLE